MTAHFGNRLREFRLQRELTQAQVAEKVGVTPEFISKLERGVGTPSFALLGSLARLFEIAVSSLFTKSDILPMKQGAPPRTLSTTDWSALDLKLATWRYDCENKKAKCSDQLYDLLGYGSDAPNAPLEILKSHLCHKGRHNGERFWRMMLNGEPAANHKLRFKRNGDGFRWGIASSELNCNENGVRELVCVLLDVSPILKLAAT